MWVSVIINIDINTDSVINALHYLCLSFHKSKGNSTASTLETGIGISVLSLTTVSISPTGLHQSYSSHAWTELLQAWDLTCGTFFRSSCVIQTFLMDCSDDSWRNTFFRNHEHSALWLLICWHHRKTLTYLLTSDIPSLDYGSIIFDMSDHLLIEYRPMRRLPVSFSCRFSGYHYLTFGSEIIRV